MALITRQYTFTDGTTAYGSQVETEVGQIVTKLNDLDTASATWTNVKGATIESTTLLKGKGTATNDSATAGYIGEYLETVVSTPTSYPGATTAWSDATSKSLTAGDWDVSFLLINSEAGGSLTSQFEIGISTTSGNSSSGLTFGENALRSPSMTSNDGSSVVVCNYRMSLSATTTVYGKLKGTYTVATPTYRCRLSARRMR